MSLKLQPSLPLPPPPQPLLSLLLPPPPQLQTLLKPQKSLVVQARIKKHPEFVRS